MPRTIGLLNSGLALLALAVPGLLGAQASSWGVLLGTVRDTLGQPIGQAVVAVTGTALSSRTSDDGLYLLSGAPAGRVPLVIRRIGFVPLSAEVVLSAGTELRVDFDLTPSPSLLEAVAVRGQRGLSAEKLDGFHIRRQKANGFFLTEEQIAKRVSGTSTDLLRTMHRVKIIPPRAGYGNQIRIGSGRAQCVPTIYLDGLRVNESYIDAIPVDRIIAVEVYPRAVDVPLPYHASFDCGVIGFWMRLVPPEKRK